MAKPIVFVKMDHPYAKTLFKGWLRDRAGPSSQDQEPENDSPRDMVVASYCISSSDSDEEVPRAEPTRPKRRGRGRRSSAAVSNVRPQQANGSNNNEIQVIRRDAHHSRDNFIVPVRVASRRKNSSSSPEFEDTLAIVTEVYNSSQHRFAPKVMRIEPQHSRNGGNSQNNSSNSSGSSEVEAIMNPRNISLQNIPPPAIGTEVRRTSTAPQRPVPQIINSNFEVVNIQPGPSNAPGTSAQRNIRQQVNGVNRFEGMDIQAGPSTARDTSPRRPVRPVNGGNYFEVLRVQAGPSSARGTSPHRPVPLRVNGGNNNQMLRGQAGPMSARGTSPQRPAAEEVNGDHNEDMPVRRTPGRPSRASQQRAAAQQENEPNEEPEVPGTRNSRSPGNPGNSQERPAAPQADNDSQDTSDEISESELRDVLEYYLQALMGVIRLKGANNCCNGGHKETTQKDIHNTQILYKYNIKDGQNVKMYADATTQTKSKKDLYHLLLDFIEFYSNAKVKVRARTEVESTFKETENMAQSPQSQGNFVAEEYGDANLQVDHRISNDMEVVTENISERKTSNIDLGLHENNATAAEVDDAKNLTENVTSREVANKYLTTTQSPNANMNSAVSSGTGLNYSSDESESNMPLSVLKEINMNTPRTSTTARVSTRNGTSSSFAMDDDDMISIGVHCKVPQTVYDDINWSIHTLATRKLLTAVFPRRVLATHCLTGKTSPGFRNRPPKDQLNPDITSDIVNHVVMKCNVTPRMVRHSITTKCTDEAKMYRNRLKKRINKKRKGENAPPTNN